MTGITVASPRSRPEPRAAVVGVVVLVVLVAVVLTVTLHLWDASPDVPFNYAGDALAHAALPKMIDDNGWYEQNPDLGAPFGQQYHDIPIADNLPLLAMKAIGSVTDSFGIIVNLFYLATYFFVALAALWVFRRLRLSVAVSGVLALLYAFLPYHFLRAEVHLFLSGYHVVPLGAWMAIDTLRGVPLFELRTDRIGLARWAAPSVLRVVLFGVLIGSSSSYYSGFTVLLVGSAALVRLARRARQEVLVSAAVAVAAIVGAQGLNLLPDLLYARAHGKVPVMERPEAQSELYATKLAQLVLPMPHHRVEALANLRREYDETFPIPSEIGYTALGLVATVGFAWLLALAAAAPLRRSHRRRLDPEHDLQPVADDERARALTAMSLVTFLFATIGGLSTLIALFVWPQIRAWNRLSIYLAFFGLAGVGLLLERLKKVLRRRGASPWAYPGVLLLVLLVGLFDQTSNDFVPDYGGIESEFRSDAAFVQGIEATLPAGAMVFQLPIVLFPEWTPFYRMADYDHYRGFLHSQSLRWSYAGVRGRPAADWIYFLRDDPVPTLVPKVVAAGFRGFYLDRFGYEDNGVGMESALRTFLGVEPVVSANRRLVFFDLRPYAARLARERSADELAALRQATLYPPELYGGGPYPEEPLGTGP